jgi:hypothetical protein
LCWHDSMPQASMLLQQRSKHQQLHTFQS